MDFQKKTIVAFGEILWDILPEETVLGGAPLNFVNRVNSQGDTGFMISRLGSDELGDRARGLLEILGLSTWYVQTDKEFPTGTATVSIDSDNNPQFVITPDVAYDNIETNDEIEGAVSKADCIYYGSLVQRSEESSTALERLLDITPDVLKFCDINLRKDCYTRETVFSSLDHADILKLNDSEVDIISGMLGKQFPDIAAFCLELIDGFGLSTVVVTFGDKGAYAQSSKGERVYVPGYRITLEDAVGAGDAFAAGFLGSILHGGSLVAACDAGNILGALVASKRGGTAKVSRDEIDRFPLEGRDRLFHDEFIDLA